MSNNPIAKLFAPRCCNFAYFLEDHGLDGNLALDSLNELTHMLLHRLGGLGSDFHRLLQNTVFMSPQQSEGAFASRL